MKNLCVYVGRLIGVIRTTSTIRGSRFQPESPSGSDNPSPLGYDQVQAKFDDVIEFARASRQRRTPVPRTRSGKVQRTIYESASMPPHRSQFVIRRESGTA